MMFRTKKTVIEGITKSHSHGDTVVLDYQPGNGTRYPVMTTKMSKAQCLLFGYGEGCVLVTVQRFYPDRFLSLPIYSDGRTLFTNEVKTAFAFTSFNDACCITELIGNLLGLPTDADEVAAQVLAGLEKQTG